MAKPIKVSQLNNYIKRILITDPILGNISIKGEISNLNYHSTGHVYFSLKDEGGVLRCFLPRNNVPNVKFLLENDMEVVAHGMISVFERGGYYSLTVRDVDMSGEGSLKAAFEKMKAKLQKEGLFDPKFKKPIPEFPDKIAVVTSETGAAIRDILKIITTKNDYVDILIYPVIVQGPDAAADIAHAIEDINRNFSDVDVMIVGRGGGSTEDLWAFNEEITARAIFESDIPVISAVGHETDFTIADYVADLRAETPTAAAAIAVPDIDMIREGLEESFEIAAECIEDIIYRRELELQASDPAAMRDILLHKQDAAAGELQVSMEKCRNLVDGMLRDRLSRIEIVSGRLNVDMEKCRSAVDRILQDKAREMSSLGSALESADPRSILKKGYSMVTDAGGMVIGSVNDVSEGDVFYTYMQDGKLKGKVLEKI